MLTDLPPELFHHITSYCRINDLKRLACCCHDYNNALAPLLHTAVAIPSDDVTRIALAADDRLQFGQHIRTLCFSVDVSFPFDCDGAVSRRHINTEDSAIDANFNSLLKKLDKLSNLYVDHYVIDDVAFRTICTVLGSQLLSLCVVRGRMTDEGLANATLLTKLEVLDLRSLEGLTNLGLSHICGITTLKDLHINGTSTITDISAIRNLNQLQKLSAKVFHQIQEDEFRHIGALENLREFHIVGPRIPDAGLIHLNTLRNLEVLVIHNAHGRHMLDERLSPLYTLVSLKKLDVSRCAVMSDHGLEGLVALVNLEQLNLFGCRLVSNQGIARLTALPQLKELNIGACPRIDDLGVNNLSGLPKLEVLNINYCLQITNVGISNICSTLLNLKTLHISFIPRITDAGIQSLQQLPKLEKLYFSGSGISGALTELGFSYISTITTLRVVVLVDHYNVTDSCIRQLSALTHLEQLNLMHCVKMTNESLPELCTLKKLRNLDLTGCVKLTADGLQCLTQLVSLETLDVSRIPNMLNADFPVFHSGVKVKRPAPLPLPPGCRLRYPTNLGSRSTDPMDPMNPGAGSMNRVVIHLS